MNNIRKTNIAVIFLREYSRSILMGIIMVSLFIPSFAHADEYIVTDSLDSFKFGGYAFFEFYGSRIDDTLPDPATTTNSLNASNITQSSVLLTNTIISGSGVTVRGFEYGLTNLLGSKTTVVGIDLSGISRQYINVLLCNRTYYFRPFATNSYGTGYGEIQSFTTKLCSIVATSTASASPSISPRPSISPKISSSPMIAPTIKPNVASPTPRPSTTPSPTISPAYSPSITPRYTQTASPTPSPTPTPSVSTTPLSTDQARINSITQLYITLLHRSPDSSGLNYFVNSSMSIGQIRSILMNSQEYLNLQTVPTPTPSLTPTPTPTYSPSSTIPPSGTSSPSPTPSSTPSSSPVSYFDTQSSASIFDAFKIFLNLLLLK